MMKQHSIHEDIVGHIREQDLYSNWMGVEILELKEKGCTIIFSTHRMETVEDLCDHIALIDKSKKIFRSYVFKNDSAVGYRFKRIFVCN